MQIEHIVYFYHYINIIYAHLLNKDDDEDDDDLYRCWDNACADEDKAESH